MTANLQFSDVWIDYGEGFPVLRGLTFALARGEIALLTGENGAGKTTAFDIASGNRKASHGSIFIRGNPIIGKLPEELVQLGLRRMYQVPSVFGSVSIRDNVLIGADPNLYASFRLWPSHKRREQMWEKVRASMAPLFDVCPFLKSGRSVASDLSFGQQRIVDFLRVVVAANDDAILLLDEPFAGIHSSVTEVMWNKIQDLARSGTSVLMVEHENEAARYNGVRRLQLAEGRVQ